MKFTVSQCPKCYVWAWDSIFSRNDSKGKYAFISKKKKRGKKQSNESMILALLYMLDLNTYPVSRQHYILFLSPIVTFPILLTDLRLFFCHILTYTSFTEVITDLELTGLYDRCKMRVFEGRNIQKIDFPIFLQYLCTRHSDG